MISPSVIDNMTPGQLSTLNGILSVRERRILNTLQNSNSPEELGAICRACHNESQTSLGKAARGLQNKIMGVLGWDGVMIVTD